MKPSSITIHCTGTQANPNMKSKHIPRDEDTDYNYIIEASGNLVVCDAFNDYNINVFLVGGTTERRTPTNNFTVDQFNTLMVLVKTLQSVYNIASDDIRGHSEWNLNHSNIGACCSLKECPCFDVNDVRCGLTED